MMRKRFMMLISIVMTLSMLVACGGTGTTPSESPAAASDAAPASSESVQASESSGGEDPEPVTEYEKVTITYAFRRVRKALITPQAMNTPNS